ncbi:hypothetical protein SEA_DUMPTRUCK_34 [Gordonia phage DumpTruck]|nr:hypothetical protein SEA_DUMPTRUCK_34 [Gordonia phage DumpTruck]
MEQADVLRQGKKVNAAIWFIRAVTLVSGGFAIGYGVLTFLFGKELWGNGAAMTYDAALTVPYAPQSWGLVAMTLGVLIIFSELKEARRAKTVFMGLQGVWCFIFASYFLIDCLSSGHPFGAPGVLVYSFVGTIFLLCAMLAWAWRDKSED